MLTRNDLISPKVNSGLLRCDCKWRWWRWRTFWSLRCTELRQWHSRNSDVGEALEGLGVGRGIPCLSGEESGMCPFPEMLPIFVCVKTKCSGAFSVILNNWVGWQVPSVFLSLCQWTAVDYRRTKVAQRREQPYYSRSMLWLRWRSALLFSTSAAEAAEASPSLEAPVWKYFTNWTTDRPTDRPTTGHSRMRVCR